MMDKNFLISGTAINSYAQGPLKLPTRKFYNVINFNNNQYQHEIANHYRDYKLKRRIRQRKSKQNLSHHRKVETSKVLMHEYQQELPIAVHIFPSFEKVYAPRGRQSLCEQRKPDLTHNDTIKRIQSSKENIEILKKLAKKQIEGIKQHYQSKKWPNDFQTADKINVNKFKERRQQRRRSLGKLESVDDLKRQPQQFPLKSGCSAILPFSTKTQHFESAGSYDSSAGFTAATKTLKYYLQLATDYYQQGFLKNIKYLENLGERNQLRRTKRKLQLQQEQQQQQQACTFGELSCNTTANIVTKTSSSLEIELATDATVNSCRIKQKQISKNNPIVWHKRQHVDKKLMVNDFVFNNIQNGNCDIRVNIKRQRASTSYQGNLVTANKAIDGKKKIVLETNDFNSMKYTQLQHQQQHEPYHPQQQQQHQQQTHYQNTSVHNQNNPAKVQLIDTIIDNLRELDIQENCTNLPRITLTDYTHRCPTELNSDYQTQNSTVSCLEDRKKRLNYCLLKESRLDCSNLDIPLEADYHSEARPP